MCRAATRRDHQRRWHRQPHRARARNDEDRDGRRKRLQHRALAGDHHPGGERGNREGQDDRHEHGAHRVGQRLDRRPRALRVAHQLSDALQRTVSADVLRTQTESARAVDRAAEHRVTRPLLDGQALTREHRFVQGTTALQDRAIHRHALPRPHQDDVAGRHGVHRHVYLLAIAEHARRLRLQVGQRTQGR